MATSLASLLLAGFLRAGTPAATADEPLVIPVLPDVVCDYGENQPRMPGPSSTRAELYDLILGQRLRSAERREVLTALRARFAGEATEAFAAMAETLPPDSDASVALFEAIIRRHAGSPDPDLQLEVARARWMLILAWRSRHVGKGEDGHNLWVAETYRNSVPGRRWSALLDDFLRDYRGRGEMFDEFIARAEYEALYREAADQSPGEHVTDPRYLDPEVAAIGARLRDNLGPLIARYRGSPNERVQRTVVNALDAYRRWDRGLEAIAPHLRAIIADYRDARDIELRATVNASYDFLRDYLEESGDSSGLARLSAEHEAWRAAYFDVDCGPEPRWNR